MGGVMKKEKYWMYAGPKPLERRIAHFALDSQT